MPELTNIQEEILRRFKRPRATPGYAGGTLQEQLDRSNAQQSAPTGQQAITRPRRTYNTSLNPEEEAKFEVWKPQNAPNDSGADYDLRGAFRAGAQPDATGHWPDTFKKPNHPTFSNESQYAVGGDAARAGSWRGNVFAPPLQADAMAAPVDGRRQQPQAVTQRSVFASPQRNLRPLANDLPGQGDHAAADPRRERILNAMQGSIFAPPQQPVESSRPSGQMLTPANQTTVSRSRSVFAPPPSSDPSALNKLSLSANGSEGNVHAMQQPDAQPQPYDPRTVLRPRRATVETIAPAPLGPPGSERGLAASDIPRGGLQRGEPLASSGDEPFGTRLRRTEPQDGDMTASEPPRFDGKPILGQPFGSSGEAFGGRPRRAEPRDFIADDAQYLRDLENQPRTWQDKAADAFRELMRAKGNPRWAALTDREREIAKAQRQLGVDLEVGQRQAQIGNAQAATSASLNRPPAESTRIVDEGEYSGVSAGTEIRQTWNGREMVDVIGRGGKPVVSKSPPAERAAAREIKYNRKGEAVLVPKDGGPAMPVFNLDGTPLTKQVNESGNVQTAYRLADDGITQIQIERDEPTGEWVDSLGPGRRPIVRDKVSRIDPITGAPVSTIITDNRLTTQQRQENERKRKSFESETTEWIGKEKSFRQNKSAEDEAIRTKTAQLQRLHTERPSGYGGLTGGTRSQHDIDVDKARLLKEIETHRTNATHFQTEADKTASAATEARRNAGLYSESGGSQGVIGRAPARDGKHHYTSAEIRAQAESAGVSYESLYNKLKGNKRVVIDE